MSKESFRNFVIRWNNKYPLDRWLREKYKLRFNSPDHRNTNLADAYFQYIEDQLFDEIRKEVRVNAEKAKRHEEEGWLRPRKIEIDEDIFSNIDYSLFDDDEKEDSI